MTVKLQDMASGLATFHLQAALLLTVALLLLWRLQQPARRIAVARATMAGIPLLALIHCIPGWSYVHLLEADNAQPTTAPVVANFDNEASPSPWTSRQLETSAPGATAFTPAATAPSPDAKDSFPSLMNLLAAIHIAGSIVVAAWLLLGGLGIRRLKSKAQPAPPWVVAEAASLRPGTRLPQLLLSSDIRTPVAVGLRSPAVILPQTFVDRTDRSERAALLTHELAHIEAKDLWLLATVRWATLLLWPQPLFWGFRRQTRLAQEALADAAAASVTSSEAYAEQLVRWARLMPDGWRSRARLSSAVGLWENPSQLRQRIAILLDESVVLLRKCSRRWRLASLAGMGLTAAAASVVAIQPPERSAATSAEPDAVEILDGDATGQDDGKTKSTPEADTATAATRIKSMRSPNQIALVANDTDGQPVASAEAVLYRVVQSTGKVNEVAKKQTDRTGRVVFEQVLPLAEAEEYRRRERDGDIPAMPDVLYVVAIRQDGLATGVYATPEWHLATTGVVTVETMPPAATLSGTVTNRDGNPVADALVAVGSTALLYAVEGVNAVRTNPSGQYEFAHLAPFDLEEAAGQGATAVYLPATGALSYRPDDAPPSPNVDPRSSFVVVRHPDFGMAREIAGNIPGQFDVRLTPGGKVEGRIAHAVDGRPAADVLVRVDGVAELRDSNDPRQLAEALVPPPTAVQRTDQEGKFVFDRLPESAYHLKVVPDHVDLNRAEWVSGAPLPLEVQAESTIDVGKIKLFPPATLDGEVIAVGSGDPIDATGSDVRASLLFRPAEGPHSYLHLARDIELQPNGGFRTAAPPGRFRTFMIIQRSNGEELYRSPDDHQQVGQVVEFRSRKTTEAKLPVESFEQITAEREALSRAYEVMHQAENEGGDLVDGVEAFSDAVARFPNSLYIRAGRASAYEKMNEDGKAAADYEAILTRYPSYYPAVYGLARLRASSSDAAVRDGQQAIALAKQIGLLHAGQLDATSPTARLVRKRVLAAAYAEAGDFERATRLQKEVIEIDPKNPEHRERLKLYEARQPYRKPR